MGLENIGLEAIFATDEFKRGVGEYLKGLDQSEKKTHESAGILGKVLGGIGKAAGGLLVAGVGAAAAAIGAMGGFIASSIGPASDLSETISKTNVVFGKYGFQMEMWGRSAAKAMGMSENAALSAASTYGNLFRSMGMTEVASMDMSQGLVQLASDLASFNNLDPTEVMEKLRAGLTGESEPLKSLGVNINENIIKQKALAMGMKLVRGEMTAAQKAQAVYALVMEQTSLAQGDFARTSGGLANQQRILAATMEDLKAKVGTAVLPAVNQLMNALTTFLGSPEIQAGLQQLTQWLATNLPIAIQTAMTYWTTVLWPALQQVWAWINTSLIPTITTIYNWLAVNLPPVIQALSAFWQNVLLPAIQAVGNWISTVLVPILAQIFNWLSVNVPIAINTLVAVWQGILYPALLLVWNWINTNLIPILRVLGEIIGVVLQIAATIAAGIWQNLLLPALTAVWDFIQANVMPILRALGDYIAKTFTPVIQAVAKFVGENVVNAFKWLTGVLRDVTNWLEQVRRQLAALKLPAWMTPGSPTPWEIGLVGVNDALQLITRSLPSMQLQLSRTGENGPALTQSAAASPGFTPAANVQNISNVFNLGGQTVNSGMDVVSLRSFILTTVREAL